MTRWPAGPVERAAVFWLIAGLVWAAGPHVARLPLWISAGLLLAGTWRVLHELRAWRLPGRAVRMALLAAALAGTHLAYGTIVGRQAGVALLLCLLALKLLELRTRRDAMLVVFLTYFVVVTQFLFSQSVQVLLYMLPAILMGTAALAALTRPTAPAAAHTRVAATLLAQAVPVMLVLFVLFPRVAGPLWGLPKDAFAATTGLSDTMTPGSISHLARSDAVAFRVRFDDTPPAAKELYWRGPVLEDFDGRAWRGAPAGRPGPPPGLQALGPPLDYWVTLEPHGMRWLLGLEMPYALGSSERVARMPGAGPGRIGTARQMVAAEPVRRRLRYRVRSYVRHRTGAARLPHPSARRLPREIERRVAALARRWQKASSTDGEIVQRALAYFRDEPFFYTLEPPLLGAHPTADFLFQTRRGYCEHFASAFTVLMRAAGVPARVVTGYQGGELNPVGEYLLVRQSDAHAWSEVWLRGQGWRRVDPTAVIPPQRIESTAGGAARTAAAPFGAGDAGLLQGLLRGLQHRWDALNHAWNRWVLAYGPKRQREFLSGLGFGAVRWQQMAAALAVAVGAILALYAVSMLMLRRRHPDPAAAAYARFCAKLAQRGLGRGSAEGPLVFAERVRRARPDLAPQAELISRLYMRLRYGDAANPDWLADLRRHVRRFRA